MSAKKPLTPEQRQAKNKRDRESKQRRKAEAQISTLISPAKPAKPIAKIKKPASKPAKAAPKSGGKTPKKVVSKKPPLPVTVKLVGGNTVTAPSTVKIKQNGITRPKPTAADGTPKITNRVWQIADDISAQHAADAKEESKRTRKKVEAKPATRQEVLNVCNAEKIKYSTFSNEFYRWRKFNGLFGRIRKDGVVAAVTGGPRRGAQAPKPKGKKPPLPAKKPAAKPAAQAKAPAKVKAPAKSKPKAKKKPAAKAPVVVDTPSPLPEFEAPAQTVLPFPVASFAPAAASV